MIIIRQDGSIVNFDNVTDINIFDTDGVFSVLAWLPYMCNDEPGYTVLGEYNTVEQAKEQLELMVHAFQRDAKVYTMAMGDDK